jgi:hypothetical protein
VVKKVAETVNTQTPASKACHGLQLLPIVMYPAAFTNQANVTFASATV